MADNIPNLDDLLKSIQEEDDDNIPGLDDLLESIKNEDAPQSSSALAVIPKKPEDLVEEDIDSQILSILGLEEVFDLTYEEYASLLKEASIKGRMANSQMTTGSIELVTNELKRVKGKTGSFKVKPKKVDINKVLDRKQPTPSGAIVKAQKLIPQAAEVAPDQEKKPVVDTENLQEDLIDGIGNILESLITIRTLLSSQSKDEQKAAQEDRKETEKKKKKERESTLEKKKPKSPILKALTKPVDDFFGAIKKFFTNVLLGSVVLGIFKWLKDPKNQQAVDGFANFLQNNAGLILGGLLALALLPVAPMLLGLTKTLLGGVGLLGGALGKLGGALLKIPGVAPFLGMTVVAPAAGMLATKVFESTVAPQIMTAAAKLDLGAAAGEDPLVRQAYSQLKEEGKAYTETTGRGGKKVRVEKSTSQMTADEKKNWDAARAKESKARELAVDYSRSNQDLYNLNEKLKNLQKEKPRNLPGGRSRSQADIDAEIQGVKEEIKVKEKEKVAKKKTLYNYLKIDPNKPQVQPQTPAVPGTTPKGETSDPESGGGSGVNVVQASHPDTGSGWTIPGAKDAHGRPPIFSKGGAEAFARMMKDSKGVVKPSDIASSQRSPAKNADVGGVPGSKHLKGNAMDIHGASQTWIRKHGKKYGWHINDYPGSHGGHFDFKGGGGSTVAPTQVAPTPSAQVAQTPVPTPSIPSPTGRGNIVPLPIPTGGGAQQASSGTAPNQAPVPRFSSEDPNNTTTMVVRAIYNIVG